MEKHLLVPTRLRRVPRQFSWVDQRLVREQYLPRCDCTALALYLLLITVADAQGLSYYADRSIERLLGLGLGQLAAARAGLIRAGLIAFEAPLYQVLSLETPPPAPVAAVHTASSDLSTAPVHDLRSRECAGAALRSMRELLRHRLSEGP